jgi:hypothetical protein
MEGLGSDSGEDVVDYDSDPVKRRRQKKKRAAKKQQAKEKEKAKVREAARCCRPSWGWGVPCTLLLCASCLLPGSRGVPD